MAARKAKKQAAAKKPAGDEKSTTAGEEKRAEAAETATAAAATSATDKKSAKRAGRRSKPQPKKRGHKPERKAAAPKKSAMKAAPAGKRRGAGKRYTDAERQSILAAAKSEGLSGAQVSKRFGVSTLTYYTWRKRSGAKRGRTMRAETTGAAVGRTLGKAVNLADMIRREIRAHIGRLIPDILKSEIGGAMSGPERRRARRRG